MKPIIEIFKQEGYPFFRVLVGGCEIPNLRSFEIRISNEKQKGEHDSPFYRVEQYIPSHLNSFENQIGGDFRDDGEGSPANSGDF